MFLRFFKYATACGALAAGVHAQTFERRAAIAPGGNPMDGRCVVALTVDGTADVEVRHEIVVVRNLKGQTPSLGRFECTGPMPSNPPGFRFEKIQGRGNLQLVQVPQGDGVAAVHIDDPQGGAGEYVFELHWGGNAPPPPPPMAMEVPHRRFGTDDAVRLCRGYVRDQAARRFHASDVVFRRTMMDDQPGRSDWVTGFFEAQGDGPPRNFRFSCSVDFGSGQVRSADVQPMREDTGRGFGDPRNGRAIQACEASVEQRLSGDGFRRIDFGSVRMDERQGRGEYVVGTASTPDRDRPTWFDFSCSVDMRDGTVRSADVTRR